MNIDLKKIISNNASKFNLWDKQFVEYLEAQYEPENLSLEEYERIFFQTNELLMGIAKNFFVHGKFKDKWDTSKCHVNAFVQTLLLKSEKLGTTFHWGVDQDSFYLESYIICAENLRYMTDEFWSMVLELKAQGDFEFSGMGGLSTQERPYFENKTSTVFQMIRNFMLYQVEKMNGKNYQLPPSMEIGQFIVKWDFKTDWSELLEKSCNTFKLLYNINYQLWKVTDLANKKYKRMPNDIGDRGNRR